MNTSVAQPFGPGFEPLEYRCPDGLQLRGWRRAGEGRSVGFLSGNGFCAGVYAALLRRLPADWSITAIDMPGQGLSDDPPAWEGCTALLDRLERAFDALAGERPRLALGHSFGAVMSVLLAARRPERISHLVLLDPVMFTPVVYAGIRLAAWLGMHGMAKSARRRRAHWESREAAREYLRGRGIYRGWCEESLEDFVRHALVPDADGGVRLACPPTLEAELFERPAPGYWQALRRLRVPATMIYGQQSYTIMPGIARRFRRLAHDGRVQALPGGHCFMQQYPERSAQAVVRALGAG